MNPYSMSTSKGKEMYDDVGRKKMLKYSFSMVNLPTSQSLSEHFAPKGYLSTKIKFNLDENMIKKYLEAKKRVLAYLCNSFS